ncbi:ComEA family DNA-binding protein [Agromyces albus]|uniref:ComEA family DNA-binding protein n=1 Tax=Agromyces albus TaxID=205332 RepID=UPI002786601D|nr:ComEA family DNA-binding protein [Agromyces albus]MDQ0575160.1 competence protein ComEA [Agromyces albus]
MPASPDPQLLDALDPVARRAGPRVRIAVGAAVVLFVVAVAAAAMLSFGASGGGGQGRIDAVEGEAADAAGHHAPVEEVATTTLLVHVLGAVAKPGLVELAAGSRVVDAVAAAGGFTAEADPAGVNLARPVVDGEQLVVLAIGQVPPPGPAAGSAADSSGSGTAGDGVVHLNTADLAALDTLPRIGPALAQRIIDWRDANGPFTSVEQLLEVTGIGDAVFAGLVDRVSL